MPRALELQSRPSGDDALWGRVYVVLQEKAIACAGVTGELATLTCGLVPMTGKDPAVYVLSGDIGAHDAAAWARCSDESDSRNTVDLAAATAQWFFRRATLGLAVSPSRVASRFARSKAALTGLHLARAVVRLHERVCAMSRVVARPPGKRRRCVRARRAYAPSVE